MRCWRDWTRLIAKKRDLKHAAMQQLLTGQTRLPGFHGEWEAKRWGMSVISGAAEHLARRNRTFGTAMCLGARRRTSRASGSKTLTETSRTITAAGMQSSSAESFRPRSLIMTSRATIGECAINLLPMTTNQGFKNIVPLRGGRRRVPLLPDDDPEDGLNRSLGGSTFLEIMQETTQCLRDHVAEGPTEQTAIAAVLSDMDAELAALEARRDKTRALKQAMMQELLTGRTRLV